MHWTSWVGLFAAGEHTHFTTLSQSTAPPLHLGSLHTAVSNPTTAERGGNTVYQNTPQIQHARIPDAVAQRRRLLAVPVNPTATVMWRYSPEGAGGQLGRPFLLGVRGLDRKRRHAAGPAGSARVAQAREGLRGLPAGRAAQGSEL